MTATDPRRWWVLVVLGLGQLMIVLDATIVNIALPSMQADLDLSVADRQWAITAYTLSFGGLLLLGGRIADFTGRKRTMIVGALGFAVASGIGGAATSDVMLFGARALQGACGALLAPALLSSLSVTFTDPKERSTAFGIFSALAGGGSAIGLLAGGLLTDYLDWRWCLYVNIPFAVLLAAGALILIKETKVEGRPRYDIPGAVLATGGLAALVFGFAKAETDGWSASITVLSLGISVLALTGFVLVERLVRAPMLPLRIITNRNRAGSYLAVLTMTFGLFGMILFLTFYMQGILGYSPTRTGLAFLPLTAAIMTGSIGISARLLHRVPTRMLMGPGLLLAAGGLLYLTRIEVDGSYVTHVLPAMILLGVGMGMTIMPSFSTATVGVDPADAGVASAMANTSQQIGGSIGTSLLNTIAANAAGTYLADRTADPQTRLEAVVHGDHVAVAIAAPVVAAMAVIVFLLVDARAPRPGAAAPSPPPPAAPTTNGNPARPTVSGRVHDGLGRPAAGATVTLIDGQGEESARTAADHDGRYSLTPADDGTFVLVCSAPGEAPFADFVTISGAPVERDLRLTAGPPRGAPPGSVPVAVAQQHRSAAPS